MNDDLLKQRIEKARALRAEGYNCAQCVAMTFADAMGIDTAAVARMSAALGGGFAGQHHICGTVSAMGTVAGSMMFRSPGDKKAVYDRVTLLTDKFKAGNGSIICSELLASRRKPCLALIEESVTILHDMLYGNGSCYEN